MTLEEAVTAYSLAFGHAIWSDRFVEGEREFIYQLIEQLKGEYYALNAGDLLSCARDPSMIPRYKTLEQKAIDRARREGTFLDHMMMAPSVPHPKADTLTNMYKERGD